MADQEESKVQKTIVIAQALDLVFKLWIENVNEWWPNDHRLSKDPKSIVIMEARAKGRFYERASDGAEFEFAVVDLYEPPHHLVLKWYLGSGQNLPSKVDIRFSRLTDNQTQITIEHTGPEHIGDLWWQRIDKYRSSWRVVASAFELASKN